MSAINIKAFRATTPRVSDRLLQANQATVAANCKVNSGRLDPLRSPALVYTTDLADIYTAYRYRAMRLGQPVDNWLVWDVDVDVAPSLLANDPEGRFFFTSDAFDPRMSTYDLAIDTTPYPTAWYALGVSAPAIAPTVTVTGGSGTQETRVYAYTFVTALGEESPPSPPSAATTDYADGSWDLSDIQAAPPNTGTVSAASQQADGTVRITLNTTFGLAAYDMLTIASVVGMTDLNGTWRIQRVDAANSYVYVVLTTAQTYTSGGAWAKDAPHNITGMVKRIYRTAGAGGVYAYVGEIDVATTTYTDSVAPDDLGEELPTADSLPTPRNLTNLISLPNGCLVGLSGNELCFSDPYLPYSWPQRNRYTFSASGVALVAAGNSVIVLTDTFPILFTGSDPSAMSASVMETYAPCVSKRGVASVGGGALYPSFDGLWLAAPGRVESQTKKFYREEDWEKLKPATFNAAYSDGVYYARYGDAVDVAKILAFDVVDGAGAVTYLQEADDILRNDYDGRLHVTIGSSIFVLDSDDTQHVRGEWTSATIQLPAPVTFSIAQVHADFAAAAVVESVTALNTALISDVDAVGGAIASNSILELETNGSYLQTPTPRDVQFTLYQNGVPVFSRGVSSSHPFRIPVLPSSEVYNISLASYVPVYSVTVASSAAELAQVSS